MKQTLTVITGASRGLGLAMAHQLLSPGHMLLCISRHQNEALTEKAQAIGAGLVQWTEDLSQGSQVSQRLSQWLLSQSGDDFSDATLINNAAALPQVLPLSEADVDDLARTLRVGLEAPMQLTAVFLQATQTWPTQRKVLNISSGLGRSAMASQAAYCAVKAGMDHFTRCLALDEALKVNGAKVCSLAPGVIDTDMQVQLRGAKAADFPNRENFMSLKRNGQLSSPDESAKSVLAYLARPNFGKVPVADIRD